MDDEKENFIRKIPGIDPAFIELMPSKYRKDLITATNSFFVEHSITKDDLNRCNFEGAFIHFGEAQQNKGRALRLVDEGYENELIGVDMANAIIDYIHKFNDSKIRDILDNIKKCKI